MNAMNRRVPQENAVNLFDHGGGDSPGKMD